MPAGGERKGGGGMLERVLPGGCKDAAGERKRE